MTFEEWEKDNWHFVDVRANAKAIWEAATLAERNRLIAMQVDGIAALIRADEREECAKIAKGYATCGCGGRHGRCNEDDIPLAIERDILDRSNAELRGRPLADGPA